MRRDVELPELGLGELPILVSQWLVEPGRSVVEGDRLLEVLAGPATVDLPAPTSGLLTWILVNPGDRLQTGQRLAVIDAVVDDVEE